MSTVAQRLIGAPITGQTPLYARQMQSWAEQYFNEQGIECYCLDAPLYLPTGRTLNVMRDWGQAEFISRPGNYK